MVLLSAFPPDLQAQRGMIRARARGTEIDAPLKFLSEIPIIGRLFPKPVATRPTYAQPRPLSPAEQQQVDKMLGPRNRRDHLGQLTPYGLPGPYIRRSPFTLDSDLVLPPEIVSLLKSLRPADSLSVFSLKVAALQ